MPTGQLAPILRYVGELAAVDGPSDGRLLEQFVRRGDESAFAILVRRHGPMVLGVCRRVLRDVHAAEDAFQATFLLLVRRAESLRRPEALGPWLYGVAYRTALKARRVLTRRREQPLHELPVTPADDLLWRDLRPVLDGAINRLPAKYRAPFVLCYLDGMTNAQAARHLGCPAGTVATRLARARQQLRGRLARHNLVLPTALLAAAVVPRVLLAETARAATVLAADSGASAGVLPAKVVALMEGVWRSMMLDRLRSLVVALVIAGAAVGGVGLLSYRGLADEPAATPKEGPTIPPPALPPPMPSEPDPGDSTFRTTNFLVKAPTRRIAHLVAQEAERQRKLLAEWWLGKELPAWSSLCRIDVKITPGGGGAATTFQFEDTVAEGGKVTKRITSRHMNQEGPLDRILSNSLPHEITHTVLADHLGAPVPRWADEGAALLAEEQEEQQRHEKLLRQMVNTGRAFRLRVLVPMRDYPQEVMVLYAQGYSLTRFLVGRKDRRTFLTFIKQGMAGDWQAALWDRYRYHDFGELEKDWLDSLSKQDTPPASPAPPPVVSERPLTGGPPPRTALASVDRNKGKVVVRWPVRYYELMTTYKQPTGPNGPATPVTSYELKTADQVRHFDIADVRAFDIDGNRISAGDLRRLLAKETAVLLASDGQPVDPFQLQLFKPGTLLLVPPAEPVPTLPAPPPPSVLVPPPPMPTMNERNIDLDRIPVPYPVPRVPAQPAQPRQ
jgi:RNA polymerase sigma factor (sigma-70 family)